MGTEKLDTGLDQVKIEQTRDKIDPIRFRDETINKARKELDKATQEEKKQLLKKYNTGRLPSDVLFKMFEEDSNEE